MKKGQTTSVVTWAVGLIVTGGLGLNALNMNTNASQSEVIREHEGKLGGIEAKLERIPIIEGKLDTILETRNIDPRAVEQIVRQNLTLRLASSTP